MTDSARLDKIALFEDRMSVVEKDDPALAQASRNVHKMLTNARHVVEAVFNDEVACDPRVVMDVSAAIADEIEEQHERSLGSPDEEDEDDEDSYA